MAIAEGVLHDLKVKGEMRGRREISWKDRGTWYLGKEATLPTAGWML